MSQSECSVTITILGRSYQIKCPQEEAAQLQESARCLDAEMRKINQSSQSNNTERLAIVAALNLARELNIYKNQKNAYIDTMHTQIKTLQNRIQKFLGTKEEVTV
jgi:cell division protein ZapA